MQFSQLVKCSIRGGFISRINSTRSVNGPFWILILPYDYWSIINYVIFFSIDLLQQLLSSKNVAFEVNGFFLPITFPSQLLYCHSADVTRRPRYFWHFINSFLKIEPLSRENSTAVLCKPRYKNWNLDKLLGKWTRLQDGEPQNRMWIPGPEARN